MTLAFLSGFKSVGPGPGTDQGGSRCASARGTPSLSASRARSLSAPHFLPLSPLPQPLKRGQMRVVLQINH